MKRSTRYFLGIAAALTAMGILTFIQRKDTPAPKLTPRLVDRMLKDIAGAIRSHNVERAFEYTTEDAQLFGAGRQRLEHFAVRSLRGVNTRNVEVVWRNLQVVDLGQTGLADFDLTVGERVAGAETVYFEAHVTLQLRKVRKSGVLGLGSRQIWLITRADSSRDIYSGW